MAERARTPATLTAPSEPERLITTREVQSRLTVSRSTLWKLAREDKALSHARVQLTPTRIGWREAVINSWIRSR